MNGFVHNLPSKPPQPEVVEEEEECVKGDLQGYLEIEVSQLLGNDEFLRETEKSVSCDASNHNLNKNLLNNRNNNINNHHLLINEKYSKNSSSLANANNSDKSSCVQVNIWFGEQNEKDNVAASATNVFVSCVSSPLASPLKTKRNPQQQQPQQQPYFLKRKKHKHCQKRFVLVTANNKLRYGICTSGSLFLEYLRCKTIHIIVSSLSTSSATTYVLGQAQLRLPSVLLKKFSFNIARGHHKNFEHKTKIYTLYKQTKQHSDSHNNESSTNIKSGEIQLRFKMMFAPAATSVVSLPMTAKHHHHHHAPHMVVNGKAKKVAEHVGQGRYQKGIYKKIFMFGWIRLCNTLYRCNGNIGSIGDI